MKIAINRCYGGFGLSHEATLKYAERKGDTPLYWKEEHGLRHYYKVPVAEYEAIYAEAKNAKDLRKSNELYYYPSYDRSDPDLIAAIEELGDAANGSHAEIHIVEIPDGVEWEIDEYDGMERVAEKHRTWA